jgi:hypothetical protein
MKKVSLLLLTLSACTTDATLGPLSFVADPDGGSVESDGVTVVVPPGALSEEVTITVTPAEAITGKTRARRPSTIITIPSAWVRPFSRPAWRAWRVRAVSAERIPSSSGELKVAPEGMKKTLSLS